MKFQMYGVVVSSEYDDVFLSGVEIEQLIFAEMQRRFPERFTGVYDATKYDVECCIIQSKK